MNRTQGIAFRLGLATAATGLIGGIATPFFSAWLGWRGLSPVQIGTLLSLGMFLRVIATPISGVIADARNDRRTSMIVLYAVMLAGYAALNFVSLPLFIFIAAISVAVAGGAVGPLLESVTMRLSERFAFAYGPVRVWGSVIFVVCNVIAGFAVSWLGLGVVAPWLTVALILNVIAVWLLPQPPRNRVRVDFRDGLHTTLTQARELLKSPTFLLFFVAVSLDQGSHAVYYSFGAPNWIRLGYPGWLIGVIWPLGVVIEATLFGFSLRVFNALGASRLLMLGCACCVLRWTILAFDPPLPVVIFAQLLHGGTFALAHLGAMYFILKAVPPRLAATAQSVYAVGANGIAMGLATFAAGPIYAAYHGRVYLLMSAMGLVAFSFAWALHRTWHGGRITEHPEEEDHGFV
jgi:PPP family 3-phenylpropionic acid transporter